MTSWRFRDSRWAERLRAPVDWNSKIALVAVVAIVLAIVGSAVVIARDAAGGEIAHEARLLTWSESVSSAAVTLRADVREGLVVGQSAAFDVVEEEATAESVARIRQAIAELERRANSLAETGDDGRVVESAANVTDRAAAVADALASGQIDEALAIAEGQLSAGFESLTERTAAVSQEAADNIAVANTGLGLTTAARFMAALFVPALVVFLLYRALRRSQKLSLLRTELARERELRRKKDAFVAAASHHVKTPMSAVVEFAELLRDGSGDFSGSVKDEVIGLIAAEAEETSHVVDDLFAAARYDLGDFSLKSERLELRDVLEAITSDWSRSHQTKVTISGNAAVLGDEQWLSHAIHNLLRIAASSGADEIRVVIASNQHVAKIEIMDDGAEIPAEETERISEVYYAREVDGLAAPLGLGLSVARRIARASGGNLKYERRYGRNLFVVTLPAAEYDQLPTKPLDLVIDPSAGMPATESIELVIDSGGPTIDYQPIVELSTAATEQRVVGYEALAHFPSHTPRDWFIAAGRQGLNVDLELACVWAAIDGFDPVMPGKFLAVNISDETLHSPGLEELMTDVDPTSLVLELPVTASIASYQNTRELLNRLARSGVRLAIDQAGPTDATLTSIARLDVQIIKINRSLVKGARDSTRYRGLIRGIAAIADEIGAMSVAVGIETVDDHALLTELGVSYGQGYFYARPGKLDKDMVVHKAS